MGKIKFIYLDVGGVVILDYSKTDKWNRMLEDLHVSDDVKPMFSRLFEKHEKRICVGEDIGVFVKEAKYKLGISFPPGYNMTRDFVNRFEKNKFISSLVTRLQDDFKIGLLTNQYPDMLNKIFKKGLIPSVEWDVIIDSSIDKVKKPGKEIYALAERKAQVAAESILFVDNNLDLLKPARQRNWMTFEYDPSNPKISTLELEEFIYKHK